MLYKVRDFINAGIFKAIYHVLFESHIHYMFITLHFKKRNADTASLFFEKKMVKPFDKIKIENQ